MEEYCVEGGGAFLSVAFVMGDEKTIIKQMA
jgi:hypothetical protein